MNNIIEIVGYEQDGKCEHCGRTLKHCIRIDDGRIVGATCLDKQMTAPKRRNGKSYRVGSEYIVKAAKVAQFKPPHQWARYGVGPASMKFEAAQ